MKKIVTKWGNSVDMFNIKLFQAEEKSVNLKTDVLNYLFR
jgi:hypothetical protein